MFCLVCSFTIFVASLCAILFMFYRRLRISAHNKAVFITGCDSGFGHNTAQRLSERGYQVFAGCLFPDGEGAKKLKSPKIEIVHIDVTDDESVKNAAKTISRNLGERELWAIVNNAGIAYPGEIEWCPMKKLLKIFDVNTFGMVRVTQAFLPLLKKSEGRIINLTSISGERRLPGFTAYSMSKTAAVSFSDNLRLELKKWNIKVINVEPYFYRTPLVDENKIISSIKETWNESDPEATLSLGDQYLEDYTNFATKNLNLVCNPKWQEVVDCIEDAVTSSVPKLYYRPCNLLNKIYIDFPSYFPPSIEDYIQYLFLPKLNKN